MQTSGIMTLESRRSRGSPAASEWVVRRGVVALAILAFLVAGPGGNLPARQAGEPAQETAETGSGLIYQRKVQLPQGPALPAIVMTEFFTNGELSASSSSIVVHDSRRNAVPWRILQLGPGDFCRLAFQTVPKQHLYKIYYAGKGEPEKPPAWTNRAGLLLQTRHWTNCNLRSLDSLRDTFKSAEPFGSAFVPAVFHRYNPFWPDPEPFLSQYQGRLRIARPGLYRFFTSSQDCSFLLIDGKLVVAAPGRHGPVHDSRIRSQVNLSAGPHEFQYLHAAAGANACMVAAWQPPGSAKPEPIPPEALGSEAIGQYPAIGVKHLHEYSVDIAGEVPLAGSDLPLVRVQFRSVSTRAPAGRPKIHWNFGDGQTSTLTDPLHIYLLPGLYTVTMKVSGESESLATTNRVPIHRALVFADQNHPPDQLGPYLTILDKYDPAKLDPPGLLQLVRAFDEGGLFARAAKAGQAGILAREPMDSDSALAVVRLVGGLLRDRLDDAAAALSFWQEAVKVLRPAVWKAECEIEAADLAINDLAHAEQPAKALLDSAAKRLGKDEEPALTGRLNRVWGDWHGARATGPRPGPPTLEPWPRWARENPPSSKTPGAAPTAGRPRSSSATKPLTGPGPSSAAGRRNTPSIRSKATSRCCKRATGQRGTSGRKQSRWPGISLRSTPTLPTPTASSSWPPSVRRKTAAVTALAPRINCCSPIIPAARWSQKPGRSSRC